MDDKYQKWLNELINTDFNQELLIIDLRMKLLEMEKFVHILVNNLKELKKENNDLINIIRKEAEEKIK